MHWASFIATALLLFYPSFTFADLALTDKQTKDFTLSLHCVPKWTRKQRPSYCSGHPYCGDDASFVKLEPCNEDPYRLHFGIADGVSSWHRENIDPSQFSCALMYFASAILEAKKNGQCSCSPPDIVDGAFNKIVETKDISGSSTVCIATLDTKTKILSVTNLGDSGLFVFRMVNGKMTVVGESNSQMHGDNCPFQLGVFNKTIVGDRPENAQSKIFQLQSNDWVLMCTDGITDNLFIEEMEEIFQSVIEKSNSPRNDTEMQLTVDAVVQRLVTEAHNASWSHKRETPFSIALRSGLTRKESSRLLARQLDYLNLITFPRMKDYFKSGGKPDDITAIVLRIH